MSKKFYLDTSIWIDLYEDRKSYCGEPLGNYALKLLMLIKSNGSILVITDLLQKELEINYSIAEIKGMFVLFKSVTELIVASKTQSDEAFKIAKERDVPRGDVLHAILARDNELILVTRDNHFRKLVDICEYYKPEDIII